MNPSNRIVCGGLLATLVTWACAQPVAATVAASLPASAASTPASAASEPGAKRQGDFQDLLAAREALNEVIRAYESGDIMHFERHLDHDVIGRSRFMDSLRRDANNLRQVRMHLSDVEQHAGSEVMVLRARWEKRYLLASNLQPGMSSGRSVFLLHRSPLGWRLAAVAGDSPFGAASGAQAKLLVNPSTISLASLPYSPVVYGPFSIEVQDPDLSGLSSLSVEVQTSQGDRETFSLQAMGGGRFVSSPITFDRLRAPGALSGNGVIEVWSATTLSVRHVDLEPGLNRPALTLMRRIPIN